MFADDSTRDWEHRTKVKAVAFAMSRHAVCACLVAVDVDVPSEQPHLSALSMSAVIRSMSRSPSTTWSRPEAW